MHIFFDFFGTLVHYDNRRTGLGTPRTAALLECHGVTYDTFVEGWDRTFEEFDRRAEADGSEFSVTEVAEVFLAGKDVDVEEFVRTYLTEWGAGVTAVPGAAEMVRELSRVYRLAIVTNTHDPGLVPGLVAAMGIADCFDTVVMSVEVGRRKPDPGIYAEALRVQGAGPGEVVFVGDSFGPDFEGPQRAGMTAYLIDPQGRAPVPPERRLHSVVDLPGRLAVPRHT